MSKWETGTSYNREGFQGIGGFDGAEWQIAKFTTGGSLLVNLASTTTAGSAAISASAATEMTRTSDGNAYAIGDAISTTVTGSAVTPITFTVARANGYPGRIIGALMFVNSATAFAYIRLHLFNQAPFAAAGYQADNAALALTYTAMKTGAAGANPNYIGYVDFNGWVAQSASAASYGTSDQTELQFAPAAASQSIYGLLEARAAFTPASAETFDITLDLLQD